VYSFGKLIGERPAFSPEEIPDAAGSVMAEKPLDHYAIRFEDEYGNGGWMLVGPKSGDTASIALLDVPKKHRSKVRQSQDL
jgi:hypothetical protein